MAAKGDDAIDFTTLRPGDKPNRYLVCPPGLGVVAPDEASPVFDLPVDTLERRWFDMTARQKRVTRTAADPTLRQYTFVQRSRILGFPDVITVRFIPLDDATSTLAVFSRSRYGHTDFGVNRKRVQAWLAALRAKVP
ncbi:MAG: DUF1499 domain-containing protein [Inquilinaceae bacterium]